jgi:hypothetical protein
LILNSCHRACDGTTSSSHAQRLHDGCDPCAAILTLSPVVSLSLSVHLASILDLPLSLLNQPCRRLPRPGAPHRRPTSSSTARRGASLFLAAWNHKALVEQLCALGRRHQIQAGHKGRIHGHVEGRLFRASTESPRSTMGCVFPDLVATGEAGRLGDAGGDWN